MLIRDAQSRIIGLLEQNDAWVTIDQLIQSVRQPNESFESLRSIILSMVESGILEQQSDTDERFCLREERLIDGQLEERVLFDQLIADQEHSAILKQRYPNGFAELLRSQAIKIVQNEIQITPLGERYRHERFPAELELRGSLTEARILQRRRLVQLRTIIHRSVRLLDRTKYHRSTDIAVLTPELIQTGDWANRRFLTYDLNPVPYPIAHGIPHPLRTLIERIRRILVRMGLHETRGSIITTAFWNMDVLLVPQDHAAREMQDTFYLNGTEQDTNPELVRNVRRCHETLFGADRWTQAESERMLLRTHCTTISVRELLEGSRPSNVFTIGRIFRRETIDRTHLPEFHQVDVMIEGGQTSFVQLLRFLRTFYRELGFNQLRFKIAHFPYTEPSIEIEALHHDRWIELGGAGLLRSEIIGFRGDPPRPVLALGLGLERLLLIDGVIERINQIYEL